MPRHGKSIEEWVAWMTNWVAKADRILPRPAESARGRTGREVRLLISHAPRREAWEWMITTGVVVSEKVYTGHRPRTVWRLT